MEFVRDDVAEERQLIAPALHVLIAHGRLGKVVPELEPRAARIRLEPNRDERAAGRNHLTRYVAVGKDEALRRCTSSTSPDTSVPSG